MDAADRIRENILAVRQRIADAAQRSRRHATDIHLIAVTKYVDAATTALVVQAGCLDLGESRPQSLWAKADELAPLPQIRWHQIGHMQRNKLNRTVPYLHLLHAVDSLRLLTAVDTASAAANRILPVLMEVNISGDQSKSGFAPHDVAAALEQAANLKNLKVQGLMGMASLTGGNETARRNFIALRELRDQLTANCPDGVQLDQLSMGMSGDYEVAIEEGATMVRIGSALFDGVGH